VRSSTVEAIPTLLYGIEVSYYRVFHKRLTRSKP
jgi:hypothetical protein